MASRKDWCDPELTSSRVGWRHHVSGKRKDLANAITKGNNHREETALGGELWDMMKTEDKHCVSVQLSLLGSEISNLAREKERKRILFYVKM